MLFLFQKQEERGIGVFYKLACGDFEAIMQQKSLMNEGAMRAS